MKTCRRPDRDEPRITCGYPLPCPYHTVVLNLDRDKPLVEVPHTVRVGKRVTGRLIEISKTLRGRR